MYVHCSHTSTANTASTNPPSLVSGGLLQSCHSLYTVTHSHAAFLVPVCTENTSKLTNTTTWLSGSTHYTQIGWLSGTTHYTQIGWLSGSTHYTQIGWLSGTTHYTQIGWLSGTTHYTQIGWLSGSTHYTQIGWLSGTTHYTQIGWLSGTTHYTQIGWLSGTTHYTQIGTQRWIHTVTRKRPDTGEARNRQMEKVSSQLDTLW